MKLYLIFFFSFLLIISACSNQEIDCSEYDTTYVKYKYDAESEKCEVLKNIPQDECGNGILEKGEDKCSCPEDFKISNPDDACTGNLGDFLNYKCNKNDECVLFQNEKVIPQSKDIEFKNNDLNFRVIFTINNPLIINVEDDSRIEVSVMYFKNTNGFKYKDIIVKELSLEDSTNTILGKAIYEEKLDEIGQKVKDKKIEISAITKYEEKIPIRANLIISYTKETYDNKGELIKSEEKIETLKNSLGTYTIINPLFFK